MATPVTLEIMRKRENLEEVGEEGLKSLVAKSKLGRFLHSARKKLKARPHLREGTLAVKEALESRLEKSVILKRSFAFVGGF